MSMSTKRQGFRELLEIRRTLNNTPDHENNVSLPFDVRKRHRETELVDESTYAPVSIESCKTVPNRRRTDIDEQSGESHSFSTHLERKDLNWIQRLHGSPSN